MKRPRSLAWIAVALALAVVTAIAITRSSMPHAAAKAPPDRPRLDGQWIRFSPAFARRSNIRIAPCGVGALAPIVSVTGTIGFDPERVAAVGARIGGRVRRIRKVPGDPVRKGEVVAELESAELGKAHAALLAARAREAAAVANDVRQSRLADEQVASRRDAELAHATAISARADVTAATEALRAMGGVGPGVEIGILPLPSPLAGKVISLDVSRGQTVAPSTTVMRVADLTHVWVELAVFERELGRVRRNDAVEISPQSNQKVVLSGKVAHVGDVIDLDTRSAVVRVEVDNVDLKLRPGQSVTAKIRTQAPVETLVLPRDAVTIVDGAPTVFVAVDDTAIEARRVVLGAKDGATVAIREGLSAGERVVVSGVFALKSEVFR